MSKAETEHIRLAIAVLREIYEEYPEIFTDERESIMLVAEEIIDGP